MARVDVAIFWNITLLLFINPAETGVHEVLGQLSSTTQPVLFRIQSGFWIKVDSSAIQVQEASCFADAVELLLACFWVFNVSYAHELLPMYDFIENTLGINKRAKCCSTREFIRQVLQPTQE